MATSTKRDIVIENEFRDFSVPPEEMRSRIADYIFSDKCQIPTKIKNAISLKKHGVADFQNSFNKLVKSYKLNRPSFDGRPNFTLLFASMSLGLPLENFRHIPIDFIQEFLSNIQDKTKIDEDILDIIIHFTLYRFPFERDLPCVEKFLSFLCKYFTPSVFNKHLINCLSVYIETKKICSFHVDALSNLYDQFGFSQEDYNSVQSFIIKPLEKIKDSMQIETSCDDFRKKLLRRPSSGSFLNASSSSLNDSMNEPRSPESIRSRASSNFDALSILLDNVENDQYGSADTILTQIKDELDKANGFPKRSPESLLLLALRTYVNSNEDMQELIMSLIMNLNYICEPFLLLKIYREIPSSPDYQGIPRDLIERCYRNFIETHKEELDRAPDYPEMLFDLAHNENESNASQIKFRLDAEFVKLNDWNTAYDAVCAIWELIDLYRNEEIINPLIDKFDELEYSVKSFLVLGLRDLEENNKRNRDTENTISQLEDFFRCNVRPGELELKQLPSPRQLSPRTTPSATPKFVQSQKVPKKPTLAQSSQNSSSVKKKTVKTNH